MLREVHSFDIRIEEDLLVIKTVAHARLVRAHNTISVITSAFDSISL